MIPTEPTAVGPMITVEGLSGLSIGWILSEVRDAYVAGRPIYPVTGSGMVSADPATLAALADALDSRADWLAANNIHPASDCRRMRRDADRMHRRAEAGWDWMPCDACGAIADLTPAMPDAGASPDAEALMLCPLCLRHGEAEGC